MPAHSAVFVAQPSQEGVGYTDARLTEFARTAGITGPALTTWQQCTTSGSHTQYVADVADVSGRAGVNGTPTVKLNGKDISKTLAAPTPDGRPGFIAPEALVAMIKAART